MSLKVTGKITKFLDPIKGQKKDGSGEWVKQSYILETSEQYNNLYCLEVFGDEKVANLTKYSKVGDNVTVEFNVSTNEWNGKYFTSLQSWRIDKAESNLEVAAAVIDSVMPPADDLPF